MILEAINYPFFQRALLACILASVACGIIGSLVVVKRMASISGGLSHAAFGGVGIGYLLGVSPSITALVFGVLCSMLIAMVYLHHEDKLDTLTTMVWSVGMAIGVICLSLAPGYTPDMGSYLFGSILLVPSEYILVVMLLDVVVLLVSTLLFKYLQAVSFDEEFCEVSGVPRKLIFMLLIVLIALSIVVLMRVVGVILLIALLTTPAVIARQWSDNLRSMMVFAVAISLLCTTVGLYVSYWLSVAFRISVPSGPLIILVCAAGYVVSLVVRSVPNHEIPAASQSDKNLNDFG